MKDMKKQLVVITLCLFGWFGSTTLAQFSGPSTAGRPTTAAEVRDVRLGSYVTLTGNIVNHLRGDYYTFRDESGEVRVEISPSLWGGRAVGPSDKVRLLGEVDRGIAGRYVWVKTLDVL